MPTEASPGTRPRTESCAEQVAAAGARLTVATAQGPAEAAEKVGHARFQDRQHDPLAAQDLVGGADQPARHNLARETRAGYTTTRDNRPES